jgi:AraC-like DNA-binding protein
MDLTFNWANLLILFGALNALIFSVLLFFQRSHPGSKFFAVFIFVLAYNGFETVSWSSGFDQHYYFFDVFSFIVIFALGPGLYCYIVSLLYPEKKFSAKKIAIHFSFVIFQFVTRLVLIFYHILWVNGVIKTGIRPVELFDIVWQYSEALSIAAFLGYVAMSVYEVRNFRKSQSKAISKEKQILLKWITPLIICTSVLGAVWLLTAIAPDVLDISDDERYYPIELLIVIFNYWVLINGYHKVKLIRSHQQSESSVALRAEADKYFAILCSAMEGDRIFLDPELNLTKVAAYTGIPAKVISAVLNQCYQKSFNDFVNAYRVKEASQRMLDPAYQQLTISGIAMDSGFNSQATFQRAFRAATGMSPKEYLNQHLVKSDISPAKL